MHKELIHYKYDLEKAFLTRVPHDKDLIEYLTEFVKREEIDSGAFTALGAVKGAEIGF